ncbi:protein nlp5 [Phtheirospermum japonicum]|uniref:Protein nlp5 n=1 Tax=Phtheirospermum japonicum TaxID=374723 RepID=A0A830AWR1_9LAMI|nr:protein nlp5 [Phtheirospermum japonicum]
MDRLIQALGHIKDRSRDRDMLIQVWVPITRGGKRVLTTHNQPFSLDVSCSRLAHYRDISVNYQFVADEDSKEAVGLPGRVFMNKVPEWTPDVRFFTWDEYPRVGHAQQFDVRGTLAVPVLEKGSGNCLGVIEVVLTTQKIQYRPELESVCEALETNNITSSFLLISFSILLQTSDSSYHAALPEILDALRSACSTHGLPLAQTWSDHNSKICFSPVESACYIGDLRMQGFHEACSENHLLRGQGAVGKAFGTNQPCFSPDVSACSKAEYPLSHHARMFGLKAAVAIRLRSVCTGSADFVLEFFLPTRCVDPEEQKKMLTSLSATIQGVCRTLRVVTDRELREEENSPVMNIIGEEFPRNYSDQVNQSMEMSRIGKKRRMKMEKTITLEILREHFAGSLKDAAKNLGVCPTTLKRICRQHGIQRWPSRKIKKVGHSLQKIQRVIDSVQGASGVLQIDSFYSNFPELASPNASRTTQFSNSKSADDNNNNNTNTNTNNNPKPFDAHPESARRLVSSSCSLSSSSSQCCSSEAQPNNSYSFSAANRVDLTVKEEPDFNGPIIKRTKSDANLHFSNDEPKLISRSQSHASFCWPNRPEKIVERAAEGNNNNNNNNKSLEKDGHRIKVTCGEDSIRFRMESDWRYNDLMREISRRFGVDDASGFCLKYLDDDAEWVLLTCDDDLDECIDVYRSSRGHTIKLAFLRDYQSQFGRGFGFRGPFSL